MKLNFAHEVASGDNSRQQRGHLKKMSRKIIIIKNETTYKSHQESQRGSRNSKIIVKILRENRRNPKMLIVMRSHQLWKEVFVNY